MAAGRLAVPDLAAAQVRGAIIQGIGYALYEQRETGPHTGLVLSAGLEDYRIPGIGDVPDINLYFDQDGFARVPTAGVGLGEVSTMPIAAAKRRLSRTRSGSRSPSTPIHSGLGRR